MGKYLMFVLLIINMSLDDFKFLSILGKVFNLQEMVLTQSFTKL